MRLRLRKWLKFLWSRYTLWPPVGWVRFGSLRRTSPISRDFGFDRGLPVDRYYIEGFLASHAGDVRGHVLEVAGNDYTRRFGGDRVTHSDVLHSPIGTLPPGVTIVADLTRAANIPSETFDCIILTQTLLLIYDLRAAVATLHRILRPRGILLVTVPGISQLIREDLEVWGEYWRFTSQSTRRLFAEVFPDESLSVQAYGNVLAATSFLYGLAAQELRRAELDQHDRDYEVIIGLRAVKPSAVA